MSKLMIGLTAATALAFAGSAFAQGATIPPAKPATKTPATAPTTPPPADAAPDAMAAQPATPPATAMPATPPAAATAPAPATAPATAPAPGAAPAAPTAAAAAPAAAPAAVASGMAVKDNAGVAIGSITELKADASGGQMATIKMGEDTFTVAASALAVQDGAAVINLTQAQLQAQVHKPKS